MVKGKLGLLSDAYELISFKIGMMIDTTQEVKTKTYYLKITNHLCLPLFALVYEDLNYVQSILSSLSIVLLLLFFFNNYSNIV